MNKKVAENREYRSLAQVQSAYFPDLAVDSLHSTSAPKKIGARLAREVLTEVMQIVPPAPKAKRRQKE